MSIKDLDSLQSSHNSSLRDHLKEIEQHTKEATSMVGKPLALGNPHKSNLFQQKTDVQKHLAEIRQHTRAAQDLIGNPTRKPSKSKDGDNLLGIILLFILFLLLLGML